MYAQQQTSTVDGLMGTARRAAVASLPALTNTRVVVDGATVFALCAELTHGMGGWLRRVRVANLAGLSLTALPYAVTAVPLLPDTVAEWLLRVTPRPAAGGGHRLAIVTSDRARTRRTMPDPADSG